MSSSSEQRSPIVRFFETFFQEQNIKWMLGVGMLILIGSSLMLVTSHWDAYTPLWKSVILLGYTVGVHVAGQVNFQPTYNLSEWRESRVPAVTMVAHSNCHVKQTSARKKDSRQIDVSPFAVSTGGGT